MSIANRENPILSGLRGQGCLRLGGGRGGAIVAELAFWGIWELQKHRMSSASLPLSLDEYYIPSAMVLLVQALSLWRLYLSEVLVFHI